MLQPSELCDDDSDDDDSDSNDESPRSQSDFTHSTDNCFLLILLIMLC